MLYERVDVLDDISLYIKLYETRSFKKCAELVNTKPSTVSKHIAELEYKLGKQLINRSSKIFEPTPYGIYVYDNLKNIPVFTESVLKSYHNKHDRKNNSNGNLNIALAASISFELITPYLDDFLNSNPNITLKIHFMNNLSTWPSENISIVFSRTGINDPKLDSRFIRTENAKLYCSKDYANKYGLPEYPEQLIDHRIIGTTSHLTNEDFVVLTNSRTNATFILDLSNAAIKMNDALFMKKMGMSSNYIFGSSDSLVFTEIKDGTIIPVLPDWNILKAEYFVITKKTITPLEQSFIDFIHHCMNRSYNIMMTNSMARINDSNTTPIENLS